jgi:hypothetical protein
MVARQVAAAGEVEVAKVAWVVEGLVFRGAEVERY